MPTFPARPALRAPPAPPSAVAVRHGLRGLVAEWPRGPAFKAQACMQAANLPAVRASTAAAPSPAAAPRPPPARPPGAVVAVDDRSFVFFGNYLPRSTSRGAHSDEARCGALGQAARGGQSSCQSFRHSRAEDVGLPGSDGTPSTPFLVRHAIGIRAAVGASPRPERLPEGYTVQPGSVDSGDVVLRLRVGLRRGLHLVSGPCPGPCPLCQQQRRRQR